MVGVVNKMRNLRSAAAALGLMMISGLLPAQEQDFFHTSHQCIACHSGVVSPEGQDISIGYTWRASMMANSARDPYWQAGVRREVMDHPQARAAIEDTCATCHMPMARFHSANNGGTGEVFANLAPWDNVLAADGVSCAVCHQIQDDNFGEESSFTGGFVINTTLALGERQIFGPHEVDAGRQTLMNSATNFVPTTSEHLAESELCATCHTLFTETLNDAGEEVGMLAEQVPYHEWLHSDYRTTDSCQSCHMPELVEDAPITSVLGLLRPAVNQHVFRGGNAFMLGILNKYRTELGVSALPQELEASQRSTREFLESETARVSVDSARMAGSTLELGVAVESLSGHKLPTAYPSRRAWLRVAVTDASGNTLFESGVLQPDGSIVGNDNDADGSRFEPHYTTIDSADEVQIYESVMVDVDGEVTTGLLSGARYIKDNRLLPDGFDKSTASWEIAVNGAAAEDGDFVAGGDRVEYRVDVSGANGAVTVSVDLLFQTIGFRWAENLRDYDAFETNRFVGYYEESAASSSVTLASDSFTLP